MYTHTHTRLCVTYMRAARNEPSNPKRRREAREGERRVSAISVLSNGKQISQLEIEGRTKQR